MNAAKRLPRRLQSRAGFSLVELVVAIIILTVGLLGLAAGTGYVIRSSEMGRVDTERAEARQSAVELIRAQDFDSFTASVDPVEIGRHEISWVELSSASNAAGQTTTRLIRITITGPGRGSQGPEANVTTTFEYRWNRPGA